MQKPKTKMEAKPESTIVIKTADGQEIFHRRRTWPGDTLVEGDGKIVTKKWQGYAPENLKVVGQSMPPIPEVADTQVHRQGRVHHAGFGCRICSTPKLLTSPHPRATIKNIDTSQGGEDAGCGICFDAIRMPEDVSACRRNSTSRAKWWQSLVADTEDQAEDAFEAIEVEYDVLPFASTLEQSMSPNAPDLRKRPGKPHSISANDPHYDRQCDVGRETWRYRERFRGRRNHQGIHLLLWRRGFRSDSTLRQLSLNGMATS